ncbi:hypothetical protein SCUP234_01861 [Seiridium cupressi]|uniref:SSCRP protein n=1 Tax=Seiridium unicorne TaxID=138068 RepID=A0ABR2UKV6_9PEZI
MDLAFPLMALGLIATSIAQPLEARDQFQTVHLTFHGGPASYSMAILANGSKPDMPHLLDNNISVSIIDAPDYNAISQCTFYTTDEKTLVSAITDKGLQQVIVGPPEPITAVSCYGMCTLDQPVLNREGVDV